ncbi:MAG TPA: mechanosensitive ion channel family protein [candidate division Zixibacteria bacterium]|nr:mechanosensitive ion channel family protein [candidate division Zixibacteria bacterium]
MTESVNDTIISGAESINNTIISGIDSLEWKLIASGLVVIAFYLLARVILKLLDKIFHNPVTLYGVRKRVLYISTILGVFFIAGIWAEFISGLSTFLGIIGAGVALALKDPLTSIAGWLYLTVSRPYILGDRIQIDDLKGDVVDISVFTTTVLEIEGWVGGEQSTGRLASVPHNWLFSKQIYNYSSGFHYIWTEVKVNITYESDWREAIRLVEEILKNNSSDIPELAAKEMRLAREKYLIKLGTLTPIVYTRIIDFGVELTARFLVPVRSRRGMESRIAKDILDAFNTSDKVDLAYTTYRLVHDPHRPSDGIDFPTKTP